MDYSKFSVRILKTLRACLEAEAFNESRNLNQQLEIILKERYHAHAPPKAKAAQLTSTQRASRKVTTIT